MYLAMMYCFGSVVNKKMPNGLVSPPGARELPHTEPTQVASEPRQGAPTGTSLKKIGKSLPPFSREKLTAIFLLKILTIRQRFAIST